MRRSRFFFILLTSLLTMGFEYMQAQTLQVALSSAPKVNRTTSGGTATIFFDSSIEDLNIICTEENPNEPITKINDHQWFVNIDVSKDVEAEGICYRNYLLKCSASAEYYLTTDPIVPNQVLYYTITLPNELEPQLLKAKSKNVSEMANQLVKDGDSYLASLLVLSVLPSNLQEPDKPYTIEAERALRNSSILNNAILRGHEDYVDAVDFNSNGSLIVSGGWDGQVILWDAKSGAMVKRLVKLSKQITEVRFLPNDSSVVYSSMDGTVQIRNIYSGKLEGYFASDGPVQSMTIDDNSKYVASGTDKYITVWDINTQEQILKINAHERSIYSLAFSPKSKQIVSSSADGTVKLWDYQKGELLSVIISNSSPRSATFSHNGQYVATASLGEGVQIWNTQTGKLEKQISTGGYQYICFSPDDEYIMCSCFGDGIIKIWNVNTSNLVRELIGHTNFVRKAVFNSDCKQLASASDDKTIRLWDFSDHSLTIMEGHSDGIRTLSYSPDGKYLVSASDDKSMKVWDTTTGKCFFTLRGHNHWVMQATYSPDGKYIASISIDKTIKIWDAKTGALLRTIDNKSNGYMMEFSFSPDGNSIMTKTESSDTIKIWNISNGKLEREIKTDNYRGAVCFSPDGKRFLSNSPGVSLWDVENGKKIKVLTEEFTNNPVFSHNGKYIIGLTKNSFVVWDVETGEQISKIDDVLDMLSFDISPDDKFIVGASEFDKTIRIWDIENKAIVYVLTQYKNVYNVVFGPDGRSLALSLEDNSIRTCHFLPLQNLIDWTLNRFSNRPLSSEERQKYLNEISK